jgi:hypothetical protein
MELILRLLLAASAAGLAGLVFVIFRGVLQNVAGAMWAERAFMPERGALAGLDAGDALRKALLDRADAVLDYGVARRPVMA